MPIVDPMTKSARYPTRVAVDGSVATTSAVSVPLPARPWTAPTSSGRATVHRSMRDVAGLPWEWVRRGVMLQAAR
jgi:hypothetical protein